MADALLTDLFERLASIAVQLAKQEIKLLLGVDEEVQKLQDKLGFIKAMLDDANKRHAVKLDTEKLWLEQLQDKYYDMDDVLDTWSTARIKAEIEKKEGKPADVNAPAVVKKKVCSFFPSPSCCFKLPLRHDVGHKIKKLNEKLEEIFNDREKYEIDFNRQPEVVERPITTSFVDESNIIGRDNYREELLSNLLSVGSPKERKRRVISLVGMGGCQSNHSELDRKHESLNNTTSTLQALLRIVCDLIRDKKYFLVFDDVWAKDSTKESEKWDSFKNALTCGAQGSRILVTTRNEVVAHMMGSAKIDIINLGNLSAEHCWLIIRKKAFFDDNIDQHKDPEPLGRQLAVKCKGLPLAAKLTRGYMWNKRSKEEWVKVLESSL
nr:putative disease resistance protein RGA3 [Quercus suber]